MKHNNEIMKIIFNNGRQYYGLNFASSLKAYI